MSVSWPLLQKRNPSGRNRTQSDATSQNARSIRQHSRIAQRVKYPAPANVLCSLRPKGQKQARILLGCDDGQLRVLDAQGKLVERSPLPGRPAVVRPLADAQGNQAAALGTEGGGVLLLSGSLR